MKCFYCGRKTFVYQHEERKNPPDDMSTRDHVIPRILMREIQLTRKQKIQNIVNACSRCNNAKADRHPMSLFDSLSDVSAKRLRDKLIELGLPTDRVIAAYNDTR